MTEKETIQNTKQQIYELKDCYLFYIKDYNWIIGENTRLFVRFLFAFGLCAVFTLFSLFAAIYFALTDSKEFIKIIPFGILSIASLALAILCIYYVNKCRKDISDSKKAIKSFEDGIKQLEAYEEELNSLDKVA